MYTHNLNPVLFNFGFIEVRWYSLAYIIGILIGWILSKKIFITDEKIYQKFDDFVAYLILGIIIGGRLGYVLFYNLDYYSYNLIDILKVWEGGMSFHGGLLGVIFVSILYAKKNQQNPFNYLDIVALVAPIGIFFGRVSNFINSELYGNITNVPWAVQFIQIDNFSRHPSQLYEAILEGLVLFLIMNYIFFNKNYKIGNALHYF